jgi:RNA methyltransferase, TrmH family
LRQIRSLQTTEFITEPTDVCSKEAVPIITRITSRHHPFVQQVRRVVKGDERLSVLDGWHLVGEALGAGIAIESVAIAGEPTSSDARAVLSQLDDAGTPVLHVSDAVMQALSPVRTPSGVVALIRQPAVDETCLWRSEPAFVLVGAGIQDPGNVGAMIRAAEAGGATGVVLTGESASPWGWKALRAAMGSTFRQQVLRIPDVAAACRLLRGHGLQVVATVPRTGVSMHEVDFLLPTALLLGGEGAGLSGELLECADVGVSIPMRAPVESLNVAVAAGLLVYEARRQRHAAIADAPEGQ